MKKASGEDIKLFSRQYLSRVAELLGQLDLDEIARFIQHIEDARKNEQMIFFIGNGGSAATASHMANDFSTNVFAKKDGVLPLRSLALTDNVAVFSAIANDNGYENAFVHQLRIHYRPGDKLVAISASGNSPNILAAAHWVKKQGGPILSLVGFDGGELAGMSDVVVHVKTPKGEYGPVEDIHLIMNHLVVSWLQARFI